MGHSVHAREQGRNRDQDFAPTHWSVVLAAASATDERRTAALEILCSAYWEPLYSYVRRLGYAVEDAQDLTQGFFAHLLGARGFKNVHPAKGKFRSFLLGSLKHFLADEWARHSAIKRGGDQQLLRFDEMKGEDHFQQEASWTGTTESLFDRRWALTVLNHAFCRLREESEAAGNPAQFAELSLFLSCEGGADEYKQAGRRLELKPGAVAVAVHRLRLRYRELIRSEVARTVAHPADVAEEMHYLLELVCCHPDTPSSCSQTTGNE